MKEKNNNSGKEILQLLQENYEIKSAQDLSSALKDMFKGALQEMMNAEFDTSMGYSKYDKTKEKNNYRNGTTTKTLKSEFGEFEFETPRDRNGLFEPVIIPKGENRLGKFEDIVLSLCAKGMSYRDIADMLKKIYGVQISKDQIQKFVQTINKVVDNWLHKPLNRFYAFIYADCL